MTLEEQILAAVEDYQKSGSIKATAKNMNLSTGTVRKMLLTAGVWSNRTVLDISVLRREHPDWDNAQIAEKLQISLKSVQMYSPYEGLNGRICDSPGVGAQDEEAVDSGECGDHASWILGRDGTLTISGSGPMWDYSGISYGNVLEPKPKWSIRRDDFKARRLVIGEGITSVGQYAFIQMPELSEITLPSTVTEIRGGAFAGENRVKKIVIPGKVRVISWDTFYSNLWLEEIHIPASVVSLQTFAFHACMSLKRMYFYGNAPRVTHTTFDMCHEGAVTVYHRAKAQGFRDSMWNGYGTEVF